MINHSTKKEIDQFKKHKPEQLHLFELSDLSDDYSNTVELYDSMPKYHFGGVKREKGKNVESLPIIRREFTYRKREFKINIIPAALIDDKTGKTINYYPSQREELVEDVIRKLASKDHGLYLDDEMAVRFTYYEIAKELKKIGHGYSIKEIKQAIEICNKSIIEVISKEGAQISRTSPIFPIVGKETKEMGGNERVVVMFHPLITQSVNSVTYRSINYNRLMKLKMPLSRWFHKNISHLFSGATESSPYQIKLSNIIKNSGMKGYEKISHTITQIRKSIQELIDNKIIDRSEMSLDRVGDKKSSKIIDAVFYLYLSEDFIKDIKKANKLDILRLENNSSNNNIDFDKVRKELLKDIFQLNEIYVNNIISKIRSKNDLEIVLSALEASEIYIKKSQGCIPPAIVKTSIREAWKPSNINSASHEIEEVEYIKEEEEDKEEIIKKHMSKQKDPIFLKIKKELESKLDKKDFEKWFKNLELSDISDNKIILLAGSKFIRDWIIKEFVELKSENNIKNIIKNIYPKITRVSVITKEY